MRKMFIWSFVGAEYLIYFKTSNANLADLNVKILKREWKLSIALAVSETAHAHFATDNRRNTSKNILNYLRSTCF